MPEASIQDVQKAVLAALTNFTFNIEGDINLPLDGFALKINFKQVGNTWDYRHSYIYPVNQSELEELTDWWKQVHRYGMVSRKTERTFMNCLLVNFQWTSPDGRLFNYRIAVKG